MSPYFNILCIRSEKPRALKIPINYTSFLTRRMVGGGRPLVPEIFGQTDPIRAQTPTSNRYLLVATQP